MTRTLAAIGLVIAALIAGWFAVFGIVIVGWMPDATPADVAWRWLVGTLAFAVGGLALALVGLAGMTLAPVVAAIRDKIVRAPS